MRLYHKNIHHYLPYFFPCWPGSNRANEDQGISGGLVQVVGDWMFLQKAGSLDRSYANVEKRPRTENSNLPRGICHCCKAGQLRVAFEEVRLTAAWKNTLCLPKMTTHCLHGQSCWIYLTILAGRQIFFHLTYGMPIIWALARNSRRRFLL